MKIDFNLYKTYMGSTVFLRIIPISFYYNHLNNYNIFSSFCNNWIIKNIIMFVKNYGHKFSRIKHCYLTIFKFKLRGNYNKLDSCALIEYVVKLLERNKNDYNK